MLDRVDSWMLDRCQIITDRVQLWIGPDALQQANLMCIVSAIGILWLIVADLRSHWDASTWFKSLILLCRVYELFFGNPTDNDIRRDAHMGMRNRRRIEGIKARKFSLCAALILPVACSLGWAYPVWFFGDIANQWMGTCDLRPPQSSKVREWVKSLSILPTRTPAPAQEAA
jgi:hypothetical protein